MWIFLFGETSTCPLEKSFLPCQSVIIAPEFFTINKIGRISTIFNPDSINISNFPSAIEQKLYASTPVTLKNPLKPSQLHIHSSTKHLTKSLF